MKRLGLWVLGAALGSFAAGMNVGLVVPKVMAAGAERPAGLDTEYVRSMVRDYSLSADQERSLQYVLRRWREEEAAVYRNADPSTLPPKIQAALLDARSRMGQRIRAMLDEVQRTSYDVASRPK